MESTLPLGFTTLAHCLGTRNTGLAVLGQSLTAIWGAHILGSNTPGSPGAAEGGMR